MYQPQPSGARRAAGRHPGRGRVGGGPGWGRRGAATSPTARGAMPLRPWVAVCHRCPHPSPPFFPVCSPLFLSVSSRLLLSQDAQNCRSASPRSLARRDRPAAGHEEARGAAKVRQAGGTRGLSVRRRGRRPPRLRDGASAPPARRGSRDARRRRRWRWCLQPCIIPGGAWSWGPGCEMEEEGRRCGHRAGERPRAPRGGDPEGRGGPGPGSWRVSEERAALVQAGPLCTCAPGAACGAAISPLPCPLPGATGLWNPSSTTHGLAESSSLHQCSADSVTSFPGSA